MQIIRQLIAFLLLVGSPYAFARGGPGGTFADMLQLLFMFALVAAMIVGTLAGRFIKRMPWKVIAYLSIALVLIGWMVPTVGVFIGVPLGIFIAISVSVSDIVRNGILAPEVANQHEKVRVDTFIYVLRWIAVTYVFWAVISLFSFDLLGFLTLSPFVIFFSKTIIKLMPFILPPLMFAVIIGAVVTFRYYSARKKLAANHYVAALVFNACVLVSFVAAAEVYRFHLMSLALNEHEPVNLRTSSFVGSVLSYETYFRWPHASFVEGGKTYHWSYSERKFIQVNR